MRGGTIVGVWLAAALVLAADADALVLCAPKARRSGAPKEGAPLRLRSACTAKEVAVDPDAVGLRGPHGPAGADGAAGEPGSPGLSGIEVVTQDGNAVASGFATSTATAACPGGKKAIAGGHAYMALGPWNVYPWVVESRAVTTEPQGWTVAAQGQANEAWWVVTYAVCADATP
jgi:hypothetical protein